MKFRTTSLVLAVTASAMVLYGCGSTPHIFEWGGYQDLIYTDYSNPGEVSQEDKIKILTDVIATSEKTGRKVAPGIHAQLGYIYSQSGNADAARAQFISEERLFPESKVFMDGLISRLPAPSDAPTAKTEKSGALS